MKVSKDINNSAPPEHGVAAKNFADNAFLLGRFLGFCKTVLKFLAFFAAMGEFIVVGLRLFFPRHFPGNVTTFFLVPAATVVVIGYGYMCWKGLSLTDRMYATKRDMENDAISDVTKHVEQVLSALAATKRDLTQRIEGLDGKLDGQKLIATKIRDEIPGVHGKLENICSDLSSVKQTAYSMDDKLNANERKQAFSCAGILHFCDVLPEKDGKMRKLLQDCFFD